jgi:hypothetical protein
MYKLTQKPKVEQMQLFQTGESFRQGCPAVEDDSSLFQAFSFKSFPQFYKFYRP